jgi:uncharacterized protein YlxW (UPF0749 family)
MPPTTPSTTPPPTPPSTPPSGPPAPDADPSPRSVWSRLARAARPRPTRGQLLGALLVAALGFALVAQLRQTEEQGLNALRQSDLVRILDDVGDRRDRLAAEAGDLDRQRRQLASGDSGSQAAVEAAQARLAELSVLAGTAPAEGTGVQVDITDPAGLVNAPRLLDLVQELRDAGAEAIQIGNARVVASTAFLDAPGGGVSVDGKRQRAPYKVLAIGDSQTMATALEIPGGVVASLPEGARATVSGQEDVKITALHAVRAPRYARPAATATPSR